jgi:hypothetical protein
MFEERGPGLLVSFRKEESSKWFLMNYIGFRSNEVYDDPESLRLGYSYDDICFSLTVPLRLMVNTIYDSDNQTFVQYGLDKPGNLLHLQSDIDLQINELAYSIMVWAKESNRKDMTLVDNIEIKNKSEKNFKAQ